MRLYKFCLLISSLHDCIRIKSLIIYSTEPPVVLLWSQNGDQPRYNALSVNDFFLSFDIIILVVRQTTVKLLYSLCRPIDVGDV